MTVVNIAFDTCVNIWILLQIKLNSLIFINTWLLHIKVQSIVINTIEMCANRLGYKLVRSSENLLIFC